MEKIKKTATAFYNPLKIGASKIKIRCVSKNHNVLQSPKNRGF